MPAPCFTRSRAAAFAALIASLAFAGRASAQLHDHLECFKAADTQSASAVADLRPLDTAPFEVDAGCTIKVRSRQICFPVEKDLVSSTAGHAAVAGPDLANPYICYSVRCPPSTLPTSLQLSDQFGTRVFTGLRRSTVCAPAIFGAPPATSTTSTTLGSGTPRSCVDATPPNCDGTCNNYNLACVEQSGTCVCSYVDVFGPCPIVGHGVPECYGSCNGTQTCLDVGGACQCGVAYE
ncbi:MAG TPA: hypothetical protein VGK20_09380 [Candidatus Binatia bacterium]